MVKGLAQNITNPDHMIRAIIMLVLGIGILAGSLGSVVTGIINISNIANLGFSSFFSAGGIVLLGLGAAVVLAILGALGLSGSKR